MKRIRKILFVAVIIFLVIFLTSAIFVALKGKDIATEALQKALNRKVNLGSIKLKLPFSIEVDNLAVENLINCKQVILTPSIIGFVSGRIALNRLQLVNPEIFITRQEDGSWNLPASASKEKSNVAIAGIVISNGTLNFMDKKIDPAGFSLKVQDIYLDVHTSLLSAQPLNVSFYLKSNVIPTGNNPPAVISANGWVNLLRKDMKGKIELTNLNALQLLPYFQQYLPSSLKSGSIFFKSDMNAKNNDLTAVCNLSVKDLAFEKKEGEKNPSLSFLDIVTGGLKNENQDVSIDFTVKTKLNKPRIDVAKLTGSVVAKSMGESMMKDPQGTIEKFKGLGKELESFGKGMLKKKGEEILGSQE